MRVSQFEMQAENGMLLKHVKTTCFSQFSCAMSCFDWPKVMEGLPSNLISGNPYSTLCPFLTSGCAWVTFQGLNFAQIVPKLFHKGPLDLRLQSQAYIYIYIYICVYIYIYVIMLSKLS